MASNGESIASKRRHAVALIMAIPLMLMVGCRQPPEPSAEKRLQVEEVSGFLGDYSNLRPNSYLEGDVHTYVATHQGNGLDGYVAIIIDPVEVCGDPEISGAEREGIGRYSRNALRNAICDVYPLTGEEGPLTLRLRSAVVCTSGGEETVEGPERAAERGSVHVEVEVADSVTGERLAALVDQGKSGEGVDAQALKFWQTRRFLAEEHAAEDWAVRVKEFLNTERERLRRNKMRVFETYHPYS